MKHRNHFGVALGVALASLGPAASAQTGKPAARSKPPVRPSTPPAPKADPVAAQALIEQGWKAISASEERSAGVAAARAHFEAAMKADPTSVEARMDTALMAYLGDDPATALALAEGAARLTADPNVQASARQLADNARRQLEKPAEVRAAHFDARIAQGQVALRRGDAGAALRAAIDSARIDPQRWEAFELGARAQLLLGFPQAARNLIVRARPLIAADAAPNLERLDALCLQELQFLELGRQAETDLRDKHPALAAARFRLAASLFPERDFLLLRAVQADLAAGDRPAADTLLRTLAASPHAPISQEATRIQAKLVRDDTARAQEAARLAQAQAEEAARQAAARAEADKVARIVDLRTRAQAAVAAKQWPEAAELLSQASSLAPTSNTMAWECAQAYLLAGNASAATPILERLAQGADGALASQAKERLARLALRRRVAEAAATPYSERHSVQEAEETLQKAQEDLRSHMRENGFTDEQIAQAENMSRDFQAKASAGMQGAAPGAIVGTIMALGARKKQDRITQRISTDRATIAQQQRLLKNLRDMPAEAVAWSELSASTDPDDFPALQLAARDRLRQRDSDPGVWNDYAWASERARDWAESRRASEKSLSLLPHFMEKGVKLDRATLAFNQWRIAQRFRASALLSLQAWTVLDPSLDEVLKFQPDDAVLWNVRATSLLRRNQAAAAIEPQQRATKLDPQNFTFGLNLARIYLAADRPKDAERKLDELLKTFPNAGLLHAERAVALLKQNRRADAEKAARAAQQAGLRDHPVYGQLGLK